MAERPILIVTGERLRGRHLLRLHGRDLWLSSSLFQVLVPLIHARLTTLTGFAPTNDFLTPIHVHRLRRALGDNELVQSGAYSEYRVALAPAQILLDESFTELPAGILPAEHFDALLPFVNADAMNQQCG